MQTDREKRDSRLNSFRGLGRKCTDSLRVGENVKRCLCIGPILSQHETLRPFESPFLLLFFNGQDEELSQLENVSGCRDEVILGRERVCDMEHAVKLLLPTRSGTSSAGCSLPIYGGIAPANTCV
ncbi:hypothetical protein TNIN_66671 [Trichonephila inaurata madagascariensis]|uniref:Uncharacterized protein n=1 Tax=Trichonephila inaurata madagascariensis TaxID=2747483 RepID=A0A8X6X0W8_9ARAC|nr:hypothetical protein TNIN_66671 [Trichonephila inaurata madagascariensis]